MGRWHVQGADLACELVVPTHCAVCGSPGQILCEHCRAALTWIDHYQACPNCGAPFGSLVCTECHEPWECQSMVCATTFSEVSARIIVSLKDAHELRLAPVMALALGGALEEAQGWAGMGKRSYTQLASLDGICFVPATRSAYLRRGFDHMELVARSLSSIIAVPLIDCLARSEAFDQRDLGREERAQNVAGTLRVVEPVVGLHLLLIDDVVTTGASIREASRALLAAGARVVHAAAFARVW